MRRVSKSKPTARRRQTRAKKPQKLAWLRPSRRQMLWGSSGALGLSLLVGAYWMVSSGWLSEQVDALIDQGYQATADAGFAVNDVLVEGRERTDKNLLLSALNINRGAPILAFDLDDARDRLEAMAWVESAEVERRLPGWLYVRLVERQPMAIWQIEGEKFVIDQAGDVVEGISYIGFEHLPLVVGLGAPRHTLDLIALLDREPDLRDQVVAAVRVSDRRWNLRTDGDVDIRLPELGAAEAWSRFANMERTHSLLARDVLAIDLRQPDRTLVRTPQSVDTIKALQTSGSDT